LRRCKALTADIGFDFAAADIESSQVLGCDARLQRRAKRGRLWRCAGSPCAWHLDPLCRRTISAVGDITHLQEPGEPSTERRTLIKQEQLERPEVSELSIAAGPGVDHESPDSMRAHPTRTGVRLRSGKLVALMEAPSRGRVHRTSVRCASWTELHRAATALKQSSSEAETVESQNRNASNNPG
jgi:hypothetical protein